MKHIQIYFLIILFLSTFSSCGQKINIEFPDKVKTSKTKKHVRVLGTKVYGIMPKDFVYIKELARYQKNDTLYVQIIESNSSNFIQAKSSFTKEAIEAKGAKVDVLKNIKINEFEAIYGEGPSKYPNETKLMLVFGDESFLVMVAGVCKTTDILAKRKLQEIFKSIYYERSLQLDPLELANFEFDQTITGFKYSMTMSNMFMYAENGELDAQNPLANSIFIQVLPEMTEENAENYSKDLLWRFKTNGIDLENKTINKTKINNHSAFVLETKVKYDSKDGMVYQVVLKLENTTLLFLSNAFSDIENYLIKYKKTVETIKIK